MVDKAKRRERIKRALNVILDVVTFGLRLGSRRNAKAGDAADAIDTGRNVLDQLDGAGDGRNAP